MYAFYLGPCPENRGALSVHCSEFDNYCAQAVEYTDPKPHAGLDLDFLGGVRLGHFVTFHRWTSVLPESGFQPATLRDVRS